MQFVRYASPIFIILRMLQQLPVSPRLQLLPDLLVQLIIKKSQDFRLISDAEAYKFVKFREKSWPFISIVKKSFENFASYMNFVCREPFFLQIWSVLVGNVCNFTVSIHNMFFFFCPREPYFLIVSNAIFTMFFLRWKC